MSLLRIIARQVRANLARQDIAYWDAYLQAAHLNHYPEAFKRRIRDHRAEAMTRLIQAAGAL